MAKKEKQRFKIDFFEFSFLVKACIPSTPIARAMFWDKVIDVYFYELTHDERLKLYEWVNKEDSMKYALEKGDKNAIEFNLRYAPNNQYQVDVLYEGKESTHLAYKKDNDYYTSQFTSIVDKYITKVTRA